MKQLIACLSVLFALSYSGFAYPYLEPVFPAIGEEGISRLPIITIETDYRIDTSTISRLSPVDYLDSTFYKEKVGIYLISKEQYDWFENDSRNGYAVPIQISFVDTNRFSIEPIFPLDWNEDYVIYTNDNFQLLKSDTNQLSGWDTITVNERIDPFFQTIEYPLYISQSNINNEYHISCDKTIQLYLNKKFFISPGDLADNVQIFRLGDYTLDSGNISYNFDTVQVNVSLGYDSTTIIVDPVNSFEAGEKYYLEAKISEITPDCFRDFSSKFSIPDKSIIEIDTKPLNSLDTLSPNLANIFGNGKRYLEIGDTLLISVPEFDDDFYFDHWEYTEAEGFTIDDNRILIIQDCGNIRNLNFTAIYDRIPIDTIELLMPIYYDENWYDDSCASYSIYNYHDSISTSLFTYKRYSINPLILKYNPCDDKEFLGWEFSDDPGVETDNPIIEFPKEGPSVGTINFQGQAVHQLYTCGSSVFEINVTYFDEDPQGCDVRTIWDDLKIDGRDVALVGNANDATASISFPVNPKSAIVEGQLSDGDYDISYYVTKSKRIGAQGDYDFENRVGDSFNEELNVYEATTNCKQYINIEIRKKVVKYVTEIEHETGQKRIPDLDLAHIKVVPDAPAALNPYLFDPNDGIAIPRAYEIPDKSYVTIDDVKTLIKTRVTYYFYKGTHLQVTPWVDSEIGFNYDDWHDGAGYISSPIVFGKTLEFDLDDSGISLIYMTDEFRFLGFSICMNAWPNDSCSNCYDNEGVYNDLAGGEYHFPTEEGALESNGNTKLWRDQQESYKYGPKLVKSIDDKPDYIGTYHNRTMEVRFHFNQPVDPNSIEGNIYIVDEPHTGDGNYQNRRKDGLLLTRYDISFDEQTGNSFLTDADKTIVMEVRTIRNTWLPRNWERVQFMCHMNPFSIVLENYYGDPILNQNQQTLANFPNKQEAWEGITTTPGLAVKLDTVLNITLATDIKNDLSYSNQVLWHHQEPYKDNPSAWRRIPDLVLHYFAKCEHHKGRELNYERIYEEFFAYDTHDKPVFHGQSSLLPKQAILEAKDKYFVDYFSAYPGVIFDYNDGDLFRTNQLYDRFTKFELTGLWVDANGTSTTAAQGNLINTLLQNKIYFSFAQNMNHIYMDKFLAQTVTEKITDQNDIWDTEHWLINVVLSEEVEPEARGWKLAKEIVNTGMYKVWSNEVQFYKDLMGGAEYDKYLSERLTNWGAGRYGMYEPQYRLFVRIENGVENKGGAVASELFQLEFILGDLGD